MDCLMIFNHLNDLIFTKHNAIFEEHIKNLALAQGLILKEQLEETLDSNVFIQLFSPIVSSHRIMHFQFGNSYTTIQFHTDFKLQFREFMDYVFIVISGEKVAYLIDMFVTFARYLCGPEIYQLRTNNCKSTLYTRLIDQWLLLRNRDQAVFVEGLEQLIINNDISATCLQSLKESIAKLSVHPECSKIHALLFVDNKCLSLYSSTPAKELAPADILFLIILTHCVSEESGHLESFQVLLSGSDVEPKCLPHAVHVVELFPQVFLVYLVEMGDPLVSATLFETFHHLHRLRFIQVQREMASIQMGYENVDLSIRKLNGYLKKCKVKNLESSQKQLIKKWDVLKGKYREYLKTLSNEALLRAESLAMNLLDSLKEIHNLTAVDDSILKCSAAHVLQAIPKVRQDLADFNEYFLVKGIKNFSLGSEDSLTKHKYLEEFPGLVHFLYIDRNTHKVTTPSLDMQAEKAEFIQKKIWSMVTFAHSHLQEGHTAIIWKDTIFTYGYFLWFEDSSGDSLKFTLTPDLGSKIPGILHEDYYMKLKTAMHPKLPAQKVRAYELFVMYLGLVTASSVLEQTRKLASTIWELKSLPTHVINLI
uniref:Hermansky-Pudlak syndrome 1 protein homolog n=1 Tax=Dendroctonus ponderosae TaxID=77166 RepID=A0AAR5QHD7_DENPD